MGPQFDPPGPIMVNSADEIQCKLDQIISKFLKKGFDIF